MTVWELMQELMQYDPDTEVTVEIVGDQVNGELDSISSDKTYGCISFDKVTDNYDVVPGNDNKAVIEVDI